MYWWAWGRYGHYKLTSLERGVGACLVSHHRISPQSSPQVWVLCKSPMLQCLNLMFAFWYWFQFTSYKRKNEIFSTNNFEICCTVLIYISTYRCGGTWVHLQRGLFEDFEATRIRQRPGALQQLTYFWDTIDRGKGQGSTVVHGWTPQANLWHQWYRVN